MTNLQTLKGFRDFLPAEKRRRDLVQSRIVAAFQRAGFEPLETPTLEYKETIMGKYGEEADKLVYEFVDRGGRAVALRYDQTVPTARVMAQYQNELTLPFRRYQIQNVFRADKPQKGRYREFTQCDIDIFGSRNPLADAEILATTYQAYKAIGFSDIELWLNDRQVLFAALNQFATGTVTLASIIQSIDKLDKLSEDQVMAELQGKGLTSTKAVAVLQTIQAARPSENLAEIMRLAGSLGVPAAALQFKPTIARGLDYYTGMIFEVRSPAFPAGSLGGGGRYDNLIRDLSGVDIPAVGIGIGFDRTVEAAVALGLIPTDQGSAQVLVTVFAPELAARSAEVTAALRQAGIATEQAVESVKLGKQFKYASQKNIPYVIVIGEEEIANEVISLKNLRSGEQTQLKLAEAIRQLSRKE